jgi:hypothetical protein
MKGMTHGFARDLPSCNHSAEAKKELYFFPTNPHAANHTQSSIASAQTQTLEAGVLPTTFTRC